MHTHNFRADAQYAKVSSCRCVPVPFSFDTGCILAALRGPVHSPVSKLRSTGFGLPMCATEGHDRITRVILSPSAGDVRCGDRVSEFWCHWCRRWSQNEFKHVYAGCSPASDKDFAAPSLHFAPGLVLGFLDSRGLKTRTCGQMAPVLQCTRIVTPIPQYTGSSTVICQRS